MYIAINNSNKAISRTAKSVAFCGPAIATLCKKTYMKFIVLILVTLASGISNSDVQEIPIEESPRYQLGEVVVAVKIYYLRLGKYPEDLEALKELKDFDTLGVDLKDNWGNDYIYNPSKINLSPAAIYSAGANGLPEECGGDDVCR